MVKVEDLCSAMAISCSGSESHVNVNLLQLSDQKAVTSISLQDLQLAQQEDQTIGPVLKFIHEDRRRPTKSEWMGLGRKSRVLLQQRRKLEFEDGVLVRKTKLRKQIVLPADFHDLVFSELHQKMGHLGSDRVEELARQRFYWPYMVKDIEFFITQKCSCVASKKPNKSEKAPLVPILTTTPFEMICIDYLKLGPCKGGFQ